MSYEYDITDDKIKKQIIDLFCNTKMRISQIYKRVAPNGEITLEQMYYFIEHYRTEDGKRLMKKQTRGLFTDLKDEIYELKESGLTYKEITDYYHRKGIDINKDTLKARCIEAYMDRGKDRPAKSNFKKRTDIPEDEVYELRKKGYTYRKIVEYYAEQGKPPISISLVCNICKKMYKKAGIKDTTKLRKYSVISDELVTDDELLAMRQQKISYRSIHEYYREKGIKISIYKITRRCQEIKKNGISSIQQRCLNTERKTQSKVEDKASNFSAIPNEKNHQVLMNAVQNVLKKRKATEEQIKIFSEEISRIYGDEIDFGFIVKQNEKTKDVSIELNR